MDPVAQGPEFRVERSILMVRKRDATLTGRTSHYRGAHGFEGHVGRMSLREGGAEVAYMGGWADGVGEVGGRQRERSYTTHWYSARHLLGKDPASFNRNLCARGINSFTVSWARRRD